MHDLKTMIGSNSISYIWKILSPYATQRKLKKNEVIIQQGEVSKCLYYVEQGCLRSWFNKDGKDVSFQFFLAGSFIASFESFAFDDTSPYIVESILPSSIWSIPRKALIEQMNGSHEFNDVIFQLICERLREYQRLFLSRIKDTPQQRYEELMLMHPELIEQIPQHYIASYLGITSVSLSRIRCRK